MKGAFAIFVRELLVLLIVAATTSCAAGALERRTAGDPHRAAMRFLAGAVAPFPSARGPHAIAVTSPTEGRVSIYDNALTAMVLHRDGRSAEAGRILAAMSELQREDGSLPFSFALPRPSNDQIYVRAGAMAWLGYAAVEYIDSARELIGRDAILVMAHRIAGYLVAHQVKRDGDPRDGLVTGGAGTFRYDVVGDVVREVFVPGEISWASTEHNIDAFFFLRKLARMSGQTAYRSSSDRIARALAERGFLADAGQLARGFHERGVERGLALDCASWGALFLLASGHRLLAETALFAADGRYASTEDRGAAGHKPYVHAPLLENRLLAQHYAGTLRAHDWDDLDAVWPEGSAGVALAALRLGFRRRAVAILDGLETLRDASGALPGLTTNVPFEFDTKPSIAGTAWVELVRFELGAGQQRLWAD